MCLPLNFMKKNNYVINHVIKYWEFNHVVNLFYVEQQNNN